jgi:hypothetical protein
MAFPLFYLYFIHNPELWISNAGLAGDHILSWHAVPCVTQRRGAPQRLNQTAPDM